MCRSMCRKCMDESYAVSAFDAEVKPFLMEGASAKLLADPNYQGSATAYFSAEAS